MEINVAVVITTYNRLDKLENALLAYDNQLIKPQYIIVVNNASTDDTANFLECWKSKTSVYKKVVINMEYNAGGSGGFYAGEEYAMQLDDIDWILIADDDAYPEPNYLQGLVGYINKSQDNISIICGKVIERNTCSNIHRCYLKTKWNRFFQKHIPANDYEKEVLFPDFVSYVGILINKKKLQKVGLVKKDYFIWYDDTEHSQRLRQVGRIICVPGYSVVHDVAEENAELSWKNYYGYRNNVDFFKNHFKLQLPIVICVTIAKALLCPLKGKSFTESKLRLTAIKDGLLGNLGKHPVYKPGWKP